MCINNIPFLTFLSLTYMLSHTAFYSDCSQRTLQYVINFPSYKINNIFSIFKNYKDMRDERERERERDMQLQKDYFNAAKTK